MKGTYAPVTTQDDVSPSMGSDDPSSLEACLKSSDDGTLRRSTFQHIEQARDLTWSDSFYDGKHGIVAVFDRDTEGAAKWFFRRFLCWALFLWFFSALYLVSGYIDLYQNQNETEAAIDDIYAIYAFFLGALFTGIGFRGYRAMKAQHVAVSTEGVRTDHGFFVNMTIPFELIHTVELKPSFSLGSSSPMQVVVIKRARTEFEKTCCTTMCAATTMKFQLVGLVQAQAFVDLVVAMKEAQDAGTYEEPLRVELQSMD